MSQDIRSIIEHWNYEPDKITVRVLAGDDGREVIQLRLELGLLQMEMDGRPDGAAIDGAASWLDFFEETQRLHDAANPDGAPFMLEPEDCERLLREAIQYYHRYTSFWHLKRYELCARDTNRNLRLFRFVKAHARRDKDKLQFDQWRPYVTMMHTRAVATPLLQLQQTDAAVQTIQAGIAAIRRFLTEYNQQHRESDCVELVQLERWLQELTHEPPAIGEPGHDRPEEMATLEQLQDRLRQAVAEERYEEAARLRDELREQHKQNDDAGDSENERRDP